MFGVSETARERFGLFRCLGPIYDISDYFRTVLVKQHQNRRTCAGARSMRIAAMRNDLYLPSPIRPILLIITAIQRLCVSGAVMDVWKDSRSSIIVHKLLIVWLLTCHILEEKSHMVETSMTGILFLERAPLFGSD